MSLRDSCVKILVFVLIVTVLFGCQKSPPTGGVVITQEDTGPKEVVVVGEPVPEPAPQEAPAQEPMPVNRIPTNVLPRPEPQVIVIPESKPVGDPVQACIENCNSDCEISADFACSKPSGTDCKAACGSIIDPSACSTACSLRNANACEPKLMEFCSAQCVGKCH